MWILASLLFLATDVEKPIVVEGSRSKDDPTVVVCKTESNKGSRFRSRTCRTRGDWEAIAEEHKRVYEEYRERPAIQEK